MTRIELGDLKVSLSPIVIDDVIASVVQRGQLMLQNHVLSVRVQDELPPVAANFDLLEQAIFNLVDNAGRYSPLLTEIEIHASLDKGFVVIEIADQGPGISWELAGNLFQKFARAPQGDTGPSGTGLGLVIVKGFVDAMGGSVSATNRKGHTGAAFSIRLPATRYEASDNPIDAQASINQQ